MGEAIRERLEGVSAVCTEQEGEEFGDGLLLAAKSAIWSMTGSATSFS
jgi:hypothetical protein